MLIGAELIGIIKMFFFFSSRRRHTRLQGDWSSDVCSSDLLLAHANGVEADVLRADPEQGGRFHYNPDGQSLNFIRGRGNLAGLIAGLREQEIGRASCRERV